MPLYEYYCTSCDSKFELIRPMSRSDEDAPCPGCNSEAQRAISVFAAVSKGSDGGSASLGGSSCGACSASSCATCH